MVVVEVVVVVVVEVVVVVVVEVVVEVDDDERGEGATFRLLFSDL